MAPTVFARPRRSRRAAQHLLAFDGSPAEVKLPRERMLEGDVQRDVLKLLRRHPRVAWAHRFNSRVFDVQDKRSKTGMRPMRAAFKGCSDILGQLKDGRLLAIECKSTTGKPTDEQAAFLDVVNRHGGVGFIARRTDDVLVHLPLR